VVSDKPNAFNKIFALFLCKVYDEKTTKENEELKFQWLEGKDTNISFQLRLTDLYKAGMKEFLDKEVTDFSDEQFESEYVSLFAGNDELKRKFKENVIHKLRLEKNNEFAIKEVYDEKSFTENAKSVKEVVELLQGFRIRYNKRQQYLSDFFELLLTTGLKQESGQFFTPVPVAQFIIKSLPIDRLVNEKIEKGERNNLLPYIMDYAAGSGHFLTESMHKIQRIIAKKNSGDFIDETKKKLKAWQEDHFDWATQYVYGIEKDYRLVKVGKVGCYLHGDGLANVILSDGLANFKNTEEYRGLLKKTDANFPKENKQFDIVISNPPYSVSAFKTPARSYYTEKDFDLYNSLTDNSSEIECLFVERTKQLLKDGGMAGIILPSSILNNTGIYTKAREIILQCFEIISITELGSNTFMATGTNTVVLFLRRRNNYDSINLDRAIKKFLTDHRDVTLNGVGKPVSKYVAQVWEGISFNDYVTLLKKEPNTVIEQHELYKEYRKKLKAKNESDFWKQALECEAEKLFYFILAYPQKVVLVKSGQKDDEKRFLGYEFSNRRGREGIHPIQRGKSIAECTKLFDEESFENPEKASTYIYKAFKSDYEKEIHPSLQQNISRHALVDMLTFDRVEFEKNISFAVKKKVKIESKWEFSEIKDIANFIGKGKRPASFADNKGSFPFVGSSPTLKKCTAFDYDFEALLIGDGGTANIHYINGKFSASDHTYIITKKNVLLKYIYYFLSQNLSLLEQGFKGQSLKNISKSAIEALNIPVPPQELQEKIIDEIEALEKKEENAKEEIGRLKNSVFAIIEKARGKQIKLQVITTKIGSGATPLGGEGVYKSEGITFIRSQNVYDGYLVENGLVYIDEEQAKKLEGVTVGKNDILFNITGASIARCCVVEDKYLPARVNQHVSIIRTNEKALPKYVQSILVSKEYKDRLLQIGEGATSRQAITKSQLENFEIPVPSLPEQQKIVAEIEKIERKITTLEKELADLPEQKATVLKRYL
jgi:type I restriction enzyme M protein